MAGLLSGCAVEIRSVESASDFDLGYCVEQGFNTPAQELEARRKNGTINDVSAMQGWQQGRGQEFIDDTNPKCAGLVYNLNTKVTYNPVTDSVKWE